jgi:hypothetical protein
MRIVSDAYDTDDCVWNYHKHPADDFGDTLAKFIAIECREVSEGEDNKAAAMHHAMERAVKELTRVRNALYDLA